MASMLLNALEKPVRPKASMVSHMQTLLMSMASCCGLACKICVNRAPTCVTFGYMALQWHVVTESMTEIAPCDYCKLVHNSVCLIGQYDVDYYDVQQMQFST